LDADKGPQHTIKQGTASNLFFIEPMMALRAGDLPVGNWIYELKFDGYRAFAFKVEKEVRLVSRNRTHLNNDYPQLVTAGRSGIYDFKKRTIYPFRTDKQNSNISD
jgi:ATP-dependent DNA ligase